MLGGCWVPECIAVQVQVDHIASCLFATFLDRHREFTGGADSKTDFASTVADNNDRTLYIFDNDSRGASNCYGGCATDWPPYYAPADATPYGHYSVIQRRDGTYQWAWNGWPLYYWDGDKYPGDRGGDGIGGVWHIVHR